MIVALVAAGAIATDYSGELFVLGGIALTAVLAWIGSIIVKRVKGRASEPEMWRRLDELSFAVYGGRKDGADVLGFSARLEIAERQARAAGRIVRDVARQWKGDPPRLNPVDLDEIDEETLPINHPWRKRP